MPPAETAFLTKVGDFLFAKQGWVGCVLLEGCVKKKKEKRQKRRGKGDAKPTYKKNIKHPKGRPTIAFVF